ncbi:hypothetical protein D7Z54_09670 [Salibacterium salarium]|uniref:Uncharacterized protein n=1 Tax=Salibacterium salarium TaxID=284579 RepID=A0A428N505_9BACI|nr:hypothetical protein [Salibacterium salarium]RSL33575.1 hypothetical protein D7Z54_09670 [Salibacterium salarium]
MAATMDISSAQRYGKNGERVSRLIERLTNIDWYYDVGSKDSHIEDKLRQFMSTLEVQSYSLKWISKEEICEKAKDLSLEDSRLWEELQNIPDKLKEKIVEKEREDILDDIVHHIPEVVYHGAFKGAYDTFEEEKVVAFLVGHAMYVSVLACAWELITDDEAWQENPFIDVIDILEQGHLPLGPENNIFYLS